MGGGVGLRTSRWTRRHCGRGGGFKDEQMGKEFQGGRVGTPRTCPHVAQCSALVADHGAALGATRGAKVELMETRWPCLTTKPPLQHITKNLYKRL